MTPDCALAFGEYRLDPVSGHLYRGSAAVPLTPKAFALLHHLALQPGRLIPKAELLGAVWPGVYVGDAVLKSSIREVRKALGDDPHAPRFIETAFRRGYRFIAAVSPVEPAPPPITAPRVSYARSGEVNIAYQVVGEGPLDVVFVMGWVSHLEYFWNEPSFAGFLERLSRKARLILFDKRGTGLSDRVNLSELPSLEQRMDDVRAVMEAAGSTRAVLMGVSEGGPLCTLFAATHPARTEALVMIGSYARRLRDVDYPWGVTREERDRFCQTIRDDWGGPVGLEERAPSRVSDPAFRDWWASYLRMGASPGAAVALTEMNAAIDVRDVLPSIRVPTLVLHRSGDRCLKVEEGRFLASRIPGAHFVELAGEDHLPFVGDSEAMLREIEAFLDQARRAHEPECVLASVLSVRSDDAWHASLARAFADEVARWRGQLVEREAGCLVALFDGPGRAVRCGVAVVGHARDAGVPAAAGVHIGECERRTLDGPIFELSAALALAAAPFEVRVSRTVVDLVPGSGLTFDDRGVVGTPPRHVPALAVAQAAG